MGYRCVYDDDNPTVMLVTNLETGDVNGLCYPHIPEYLRGIADAVEESLTAPEAAGEPAAPATVDGVGQEGDAGGRADTPGGDTTAPTGAHDPAEATPA